MAAYPKTSVQIPNLFVGFLSEEPVINPNYAAVRAESESVISRSRVFSPRQIRAIIDCNFSYFAAVMVPFAELELLRVICDWGNWIFPFDDLFDNGDVRKDFIQAQRIMQYLEETMNDGNGKMRSVSVGNVSSKSGFDLAQMHEGIHKAIAERSSTAIGNRYVASMRQYCAGTLAQVRQVQTAHAASFQEVLTQRRQSVCVAPLFALVELGHKIDLPNDAFDDPHIRRLEILAIEITLLHNDLLSYCKEEEEGVPHNAVMACRMQGMGVQEAVDFLGQEVSHRMETFENATCQLKKSGHGHLGEMMRYIQGVADVVKANLYWSFKSDRFLSPQQKSRLRTAGTLEVAINVPHGYRQDAVLPTLGLGQESTMG